MAEKTCFVIIGFGKKVDYSTGRTIDLDKTFEYIIKPVFEELGFVCFRGCDIKHSGTIDVHMLENILKSDFVVADLSTLNPNVLYELGIRHAVRRNTTIIIAERELTYPFDLSHIVIDKYEHLGVGIDHGEVLRFREELNDKVLKLLSSPEVDSPLYSLFPKLEVPRFSKEEVEEIKESIREEGSLSDLITAAEKAREARDYLMAIEILEKAIELKQDNMLVTQQLAVMTYKSQTPTPTDALFRAELILSELKPETTTNVETLGIAGAINKRLYEELDEEGFLDKAIRYYERGYYIGNDYYNGINLAYLFTIKASIEEDQFQAYANYGNAITTRKKVIGLCESLIDAKGWAERNDRHWVYFTLAEAFFALDQSEREKEMLEEAKKASPGEFSFDSYHTQRAKLLTYIDTFKERYFQ